MPCLSRRQRQQHRAGKLALDAFGRATSVSTSGERAGWPLDAIMPGGERPSRQLLGRRPLLAFRIHSRLASTNARASRLAPQRGSVTRTVPSASTRRM